MASYRTLLVDDEEELVSTLVERLGYRGIEADYALNGNEALQKLRSSSYDIVILDFKMPGMSGIEVMGIVNREFPHIPVLLITGHGSPTDELEKIPEGAFDYLPKPINIETLIEKMQEALDRK